MPPAAAVVGMSVASPDPIEAPLLSSQLSEDDDASMNDGDRDNATKIDLISEMQISSKMRSSCNKRGTPPLSNTNADEEEENYPISAKKHRGSNDDEELEDDEDFLEKENKGHRRADRMNKNRRNTTTRPSSSSSTINAALNGHRNVNAVGKPPEAGIILKIYVENFMCHRKLTVDLCRNVNFIYGQNGSGKVRSLHSEYCCLDFDSFCAPSF
jgi:hypothetical protein